MSILSDGLKKLKFKGDKVYGYEPYFIKDYVIVARINHKQKRVSHMHGYFPAHPYGERVVQWAKRHGYAI